MGVPAYVKTSAAMAEALRAIRRWRAKNQGNLLPKNPGSILFSPVYSLPKALFLYLE
jgi:hypothetical protein